MVNDIVINSNGIKWIATILGLALYRGDGVPQTHVDTGSLKGPHGFALTQNYPNPFCAEGRGNSSRNPTTAIRFSLDTRSHVTLKLYNTAGQEIVELFDQEADVGEYSVVWDGRDGRGLRVSAGVYFAELSSESTRKVIKLQLVR
jgi:hypothetical protein